MSSSEVDTFWESVTLSISFAAANLCSSTRSELSTVQNFCSVGEAEVQTALPDLFHY